MGILSFLFRRQAVAVTGEQQNKYPVTASRYPFYIKTPAILGGLTLFIYILILLQDIVVPICFAVLIAILLNPFVNRLVKWCIPKPVSIFIALLIAVLCFLGLLAFLSSQVSHFTGMAPQLKQRGSEILQTIQSWVETTFHYPKAKQDLLLQNAGKNTQPYLTGVLGSLMGIISVLVLLPIYIFLILYYKPLFLTFIFEVFEDRQGGKVAEILSETKRSIQTYVTGLLIEMLIVAALNSIALLILGVKYAVLLGIIGAILNLVPYIGGIIAIALPVIISLVTGDGSITTPLLVVGSYLVIQFIDNNFLVPKIVSSRVDVNAFVSIIVVLLGGAMWGVSGMFLSIPFTAICKIIFDRIDPLKPWGKLLGVKMDEQVPNQVVSETDKEAVPDKGKTTNGYN